MWKEHFFIETFHYNDLLAFMNNLPQTPQQSAVRNAFAPYRQVRVRGACNMRDRAGQFAASSSPSVLRFGEYKSGKSE